MLLNPMSVGELKITDTVNQIIAATQNEQASDPIWLKENVAYTFTSTLLNTGEEILADVYDFSTSSWQPYYFEGSQVKLSHHHEQIVISGVTCLIKFMKAATENNVGLIMAYR